MISVEELKQQLESTLNQETLAWLNVSDDARALFQKGSLPTRKTEQWKYSPLTPLLKQSYFETQELGSPGNANGLSTSADAIQNTQRLVFVDGQFNRELSDYKGLEQQGLVSLFSECNEQQQQLVKQHLGRVCPLDQHIFASANYAALNEGVLIHVPANQVVEPPICLVYLTTPSETPRHHNTRILVVAETSSQLSLIEQYSSSGQQAHHFHNHLCEVVLSANAKLLHLRAQVEDEQICLVNGLHVEQAQDSHYEQHAIAFGSQLKRNDVIVTFKGNNAYSKLNGVFLTKHQQHLDNHLVLEHAAPHCNSDTTYKGFITDKSKAVFDGRIHIHPHAQKTEAHLNNKNLLLSNQAELNTKPELEIYADDVKCSHGASIGQLDANSLFYFQSRGIDKASAEAMLCLGFVNEMVELFPNPAMRSFITENLGRFFNDVDKLKSLWSLES